MGKLQNYSLGWFSFGFFKQHCVLLKKQDGFFMPQDKTQKTAGLMLRDTKELSEQAGILAHQTCFSSLTPG